MIDSVSATNKYKNKFRSNKDLIRVKDDPSVKQIKSVTARESNNTAQKMLPRYKNSYEVPLLQ